MSDNEPRIIEEIDSHPSAGGGAAISNSVAVVSGLDALTQSVERLVQTMSADVVFDEDVLLEDGEIFDPSLSISGENNSNENTTEKDAIVALPDDDLFNSPEECGDEISAGVTSRIDLACTKKPVRSSFWRFKSVTCVLRAVPFCWLQKLIQSFGMICPITLKDENWGYKAFKSSL